LFWKSSWGKSEIDLLEIIEERHTIIDLPFKVLKALDRDERDVLALRFGVGTSRKYSVAQIADIFGAEKIWVKKMELRALRKLRRPHLVMKLRHYSPSSIVRENALLYQDCINGGYASNSLGHAFSEAGVDSSANNE
jgi:hypothetical protein